MKPTRATPIISAEAVAAVRRGLRLAFSRARWPVAPDSLGTGTPSTLHRRAGDDRAEHEHAEDDGERRRGRGATAPVARRRRCRRRRRPRRRRRRPGRRPCAGARRRCARWRRPAGRRSGAMRLARRAGPIDESSVTAMPTTKAVMTVPVVMTTSPLGDLEADGAEQRPQAEGHAARRRPRPTRRGDRRRRAPTRAAPTRSTWRRLAPTARSIAISRMRWATMIEKVL